MNTNVFESLFLLVEDSRSLKENVIFLLNKLNCVETAEHCVKVAEESQRIALKFGIDNELAYTAGLLHDISAIYPNEQRIEISRKLNINVLDEEKQFPMIIHQKISRVMAEQIFNINNVLILNAIGCHTTLRAHSTELDRVLFVADKIEWDQKGNPPYLKVVLEQLENSLDHGAFAYISFLWEKRTTLRVIHPWLADAYNELSKKLNTIERREQ